MVEYAKKIPIKEAILSGDWLECYCEPYDYSFRIRLISFEKILYSSIDDPLKMEIVLDEGVLWLLKCEVVNLSRTKFYGRFIQDWIRLHDQDDFIFDASRDKHLTEHSRFSMQTGIDLFSGSNRAYRAPLLPQIKAVGALVFLLPHDDQSKYFLPVRW